MTSNRYFHSFSYATVACGMLALVVSGGVGVWLTAALMVVLVSAWNLEGTRWQLSERVGLAVVLLALPGFYIDWRYRFGLQMEALSDGANVEALVHLILFLSCVKLLQIKANRDWLFLYLISFFEVLLAAGLSINPRFLAVLCLYIFFALLSAICFEIKVTERLAQESTSRQRVLTPNATPTSIAGRTNLRSIKAWSLPTVALCLLALIFALAVPLFFMVPRFGGGALTRADKGSGGFVGFSDQVTLGDIGRLQRNDEVVMRVRVQGQNIPDDLRWRGVALDEFNGREWRKSRQFSDIFRKKEGDFFPFDTTESLELLTAQTFFIEPIDTQTLFVAPRVLAVQGNLPYVRLDEEGALSTRPHPSERMTYRVYSDTREPEPKVLAADNRAYNKASVARYLQVPLVLDERIKSLAAEVITRAGAANNRYRAAQAIEQHLRHDYAYTLDMAASGAEPLADFLFNVRKGHCEYFATAMAVMLRTQGIAARIVNGFQKGEYNNAADAYIVRQSDAHSWVEVYFPGIDSWVSFDPTPVAGRPGSGNIAGWRKQINKYTEAFNLFWVQYVVAYDKQEQRSLANSLKSWLNNHRQAVSQSADYIRAKLSGWQSQPFGSGGNQLGGSLSRIAALVLLCALVLAIIASALYVQDRRRKLRAQQLDMAKTVPVVVFYNRMTKALEAQGLQRRVDQTPLEFANAAGMPEALMVTRLYNQVRYGAHDLSPAEAQQIDEWLQRLEAQEVTSKQ